MGGVEIDFYQEPEQILAALTESKNAGTVIGIKSYALGTGVFVTSVEDIQFQNDKDTIVVLKNFDMTGSILKTNILPLNLIDGVCPFKSKYENPLMKSMKKNMLEE